jgi:hypothetical protein
VASKHYQGKGSPQPGQRNRSGGPRPKSPGPEPSQLDRWSTRGLVQVSVLMGASPWPLFIVVNHSVFKSHPFIFASPLVYVYFALCPFLFIYLAHYMLVERRASNVSLSIVVIAVASFILGIFAFLYFTLGTRVNFSESLTHLDAIYFTAGIFTTAGTGNIAPTSETTRLLVTAQYFVDLAFFIGIVNLLFIRISQLLHPLGK